MNCTNIKDCASCTKSYESSTSTQCKWSVNRNDPSVTQCSATEPDFQYIQLTTCPLKKVTVSSPSASPSASSSPAAVPYVPGSHELTSDDVELLINTEMAFISQLETTTDPAKRDEIQKNIASCSALRQQYYNANNTTKDQFVFLEKELGEKKKRIKKVDQEHTNKKRLFEVNNYYKSQYAAHTRILQIISLICLPLIILPILLKMKIIPEMVYNSISFLIIIAGVIYVTIQLVDTYGRDTRNYDEYDWNFKNSIHTPQAGSSSPPLPSSSPSWTPPKMVLAGEATKF